MTNFQSLPSNNAALPSEGKNPSAPRQAVSDFLDTATEAHCQRSFERLAAVALRREV
jgi:hypothetical protein